MKQKFAMSTVRFAAVGILLAAVACNKADQPALEIRLGAILSLSGDYSEEGRAGKAAMEIAVERLNQRYQTAGSPVRITCTFADTHMDTAMTRILTQQMYDDGIRLLAGGPNNSAELRAILPIINANRMLTVCVFSSSPSLAVAGDYAYRLITDDNVQARALARMMDYEGIRALIPVWREDTYGSGLKEALLALLTGKEVTVYPGVSYDPGATQFNSKVGNLAGQVGEALALCGPSEIAVVLISYQEASEFLRVAAGYRELAGIRWYGCDANVQKASITSDSTVADFASAVRFAAPIMGIGTADKGSGTADALSEAVFQKTGLHPDAYAITAYDAVEVIALAVDWVQTTEPDRIREVLPAVCDAYDYLGISRRLNEAGDLATANYIFWSVYPQQDGYHWEPCATYMADADRILMREN